MNRDEDTGGGGAPGGGAPGGRARVEAPPGVALVQQFGPGELYALRAAVAAHATSLGLAERNLGRVLLVATELATNAIHHGAGFGTLHLWRSGDLLMIQVVDDGPGIARPDRVGIERASLTARAGRGLWIVRQVCEKVHISAAPVTTVTVGMQLESSTG